jgi:hypothetical protein
MPGQSPLDMMRTDRPREDLRPAGAGPRRRTSLVLWAVAAAIVLAAVWSGLWYYAARVADRTLSGWVAREGAAGRTYTCGSQGISGFPFRIEASCVDAAAVVSSSRPPFSFATKSIVFTAEVYHPTLLIGEVTGPFTLAEIGQPPSFVADWSRAQISVRGLPPEPERVTVAFRRPRLHQIAAAKDTLVFQADETEMSGRLIGGAADNNPVIETTLRIQAAAAPTLHPLLADPIKGDVDAIVRGFKDLLPKPWAVRFRELQAAGGNIEIKAFRIERPDSIVVGTGTLTVNEHGNLDGLIRVAVAGIEHIVPLLGIDKVIGQGIDRLAGSSGSLDRVLPGLSDVVRQSANAGIIDNLKKMGQPTEIDQKPAIVLPLRVSDGVVSLGMLPLGQLPPLF